jgi:hypothetical protein
LRHRGCGSNRRFRGFAASSCHRRTRMAQSSAISDRSSSPSSGGTAGRTIGDVACFHESPRPVVRVPVAAGRRSRVCFSGLFRGAGGHRTMRIQVCRRGWREAALS